MDVTATAFTVVSDSWDKMLTAFLKFWKWVLALRGSLNVATITTPLLLMSFWRVLTLFCTATFFGL